MARHQIEKKVMQEKQLKAGNVGRFFQISSQKNTTWAVRKRARAKAMTERAGTSNTLNTQNKSRN